MRKPLPCISRIWASGPVFHDVFRRNQLPRAHDSVANFRFGLTEGRGGAKQKSEQKQCGGFHVRYFSGSVKFQREAQKRITYEKVKKVKADVAAFFHIYFFHRG